MTTCGMYDAAGEWVVDVGLPAKSGVGGGVLAVLPGQIGIALYSPRLDRHGNSVRGVAACRQISRELELHFLHVASDRRSAIRDAWDVGTWPSSRRRTPDEQEVLNEFGACARVYALHGDLLFAGAESVVRELTERAPELEVIVLDISRVAEIARVARTMLAATRAALEERGCRLALVDPDGELAGARGDRGLRRPRRGDRVGRGPADRAPRRHARHDRPDPARRARPGRRPAPRRARRAAPAARAPPASPRASGSSPPATSRRASSSSSPARRPPTLTDEQGATHRVAVLPGRHELRQARRDLRRAARDRRARRHRPRPVRAHAGRRCASSSAARRAPRSRCCARCSRSSARRRSRGRPRRRRSPS